MGSAAPATLLPFRPASASETKWFCANAPASLPAIAPAYCSYAPMRTSAAQPETVLPPPVTLSVTPLPTMPPRYRPPESSHFAQQFSMAALQMPATPPT